MKIIHQLPHNRKIEIKQSEESLVSRAGGYRGQPPASGLTFSPGLHYLAHHPVSVLVDADHLELVAGSRAQIVNLDFSSIWRIYRELNPVRHPRVFFTVPAVK